MRLALHAKDAPSKAYVVAAPCRSDVLAATLRSAYVRPGDNIDPFADLMAQLDLIEIAHPA